VTSSVSGTPSVTPSLSRSIQYGYLVYGSFEVTYDCANQSLYTQAIADELAAGLASYFSDQGESISASDIDCWLDCSNSKSGSGNVILHYTIFAGSLASAQKYISQLKDSNNAQSIGTHLSSDLSGNDNFINALQNNLQSKEVDSVLNKEHSSASIGGVSVLLATVVTAIALWFPSFS